jgi:hypothetical protein
MSAQIRRNLLICLRSIAFLAVALHAMTEFDLQAEDSSAISGVVVDIQGSPVATAAVQIFNAQGRMVRATKTDSAGAFLMPEVPHGSFELRVSAGGFQEHRSNLNTRQSPHSPVRVVLSLSILHQKPPQRRVEEWLRQFARLPRSLT